MAIEASWWRSATLRITRRRADDAHVFVVLDDLRLRLSLCGALLACIACWAPPAGALILPPATVDGPSSAIGEFGGTAVSADGSGGLVYLKQVEGAPHVFASRYVGKQWLAPQRVDWQSPYGASYPRIAAADNGQLVVVWVTQIATVNGRVQRALMSSTLEPGASSFGAQYVVDPNVGEGAGVSPSLALASNGQGLVAYRVVTNDFKTTLVQTTIPQLRPGDVLADIRLARYEGQLWSSPERVNHNPRASMRPPDEANGPQVSLGRGNQAVVAWQEPELSGVARIWARRVFGTMLGLAMVVSPTAYEGHPVTADADALALSVSTFGEAKVVTRLAASGSEGARMFANTLPVSTSPKGAQFSGAQLLGGRASAHSGGLGAPSVAVSDQGDYRIAFTAGSTAEVIAGGEQSPSAPEVPLGAGVTETGAGAVTALNPAGGGVSAWPATDANGLPGVSVREDFPNGGAQSAFLSGDRDGPVEQLVAAGSESGESLLGFREGDAGVSEIAGAAVSVPPPSFYLELPTTWVEPRRARVSWSQAQDATGGVRYSLVLDGRVVVLGMSGLSVLPDPRLLGSGVRDVQILATDASGQQTLSGEGELKVDGRPPVASVRHLRGGRIVVHVSDAQSGALAGATRVSFGDGSSVTGKLTVRHSYAHAGRYTVVVYMRDRVGNTGVAHLRVSAT